MIYPVSDAEIAEWSAALDGSGKKAAHLFYIRGYPKLRHIIPEHRPSVLAGITWDMANPNSRFRPRS